MFLFVLNSGRGNQANNDSDSKPKSLKFQDSFRNLSGKIWCVWLVLIDHCNPFLTSNFFDQCGESKMAAICRNYDVTGRHHFSFLVSKETYLDALSVPRASLLSHFYLRSFLEGEEFFFFFWGGGGGNHILPLALETKKKGQS